MAADMAGAYSNARAAVDGDEQDIGISPDLSVLIDKLLPPDCVVWLGNTLTEKGLTSTLKIATSFPTAEEFRFFVVGREQEELWGPLGTLYQESYAKNSREAARFARARQIHSKIEKSREALGSRRDDADDDPVMSLMAKSNNDSDFAEAMQISVRASVFVLLLSMPCLLGKEAFPHIAGAYNETAVLVFLFTIRPTVGETVHLARCIIGSVCLSSLCVYLWYLTYSDDSLVQEPSNFRFFCLVMFGTVYCATILCLNFHISGQIFGMYFFVMYWMDFMSKGHTGETEDFTPRDLWKDVGVTFVGTLSALLCVLVPYPMFAIARAEAVTKELVRSLSRDWSDLISIYCRSTDPTEDKRLQELALQLREAEGTLDKIGWYLDHSWWECFFSQREYCSYQLLSELLPPLTEAFDRLQCVLNICLAEKFEHDQEHDEHVRIMSNISDDMQKVAVMASQLLVRVTSISCFGQLSAEEAERIADSRRLLDQAIFNLSIRFYEAKVDIQTPGISFPLLEEHAISFGVTIFARLSTEFASDVLSYFECNEASHSWREANPWWSFQQTFLVVTNSTAIKNSTHLAFAIKHFLTLLIAMSVGWHAAKFLPTTPHLEEEETDAKVVCITILLFSLSHGAPVARNAVRTAGIVIGAALGKYAWCIFGQCEPLFFGMLCVILLCGSFGTLFIHFRSKTEVGALFGFSVLVLMTLEMIEMSCIPSDHPMVDHRKHKLHRAVARVCLATGVTFLVDLIPATRNTASNLAYRELMNAWTHIEISVSDLFNINCSTFRFPDEEIKQHLRVAKARGYEAKFEPRIQRPAWKVPVFNNAIASTTRLRFNLATIRYGLLSGAIADRMQAQEEAGGGQRGSLVQSLHFQELTRAGLVQKPFFFRQVIELPGFENLRRNLLDEISLNKELLRIFSDSGKSVRREVTTESIAGWSARLASWEEFLEEHVKHELAKLSPTSADSCGFGSIERSEEYCAQVSLVVVTVSALMEAMNEFRQAALCA